MVLAIVALVAVLVLSAWEWVRILRSVYQWLLGAIAPSDRDTALLASSAQRDPDWAFPPRTDRCASSRGDLHSSAYLLAVPIGAIDPAPNMSAFGAGLEVIVFTILFGIGSLLVLNWVIKTMRGSD
jgi:hypothetical protein